MSMMRRPAWRRALRSALRVGAVAILCIPIFVVTAGAVGLGALVYGDLEGTVPEARPTLKSEPSRVYLRNPDGTMGEQIAEFREFDITLPMTREQVPKVLKDAVVAAEDQEFWTHRGVDPLGLVRAAQANFEEGETVQGGSTITQQLVRERYLSRDQTVERKFNEVLLATRFERDLTSKIAREQNLSDEDAEREAKEQILFEYLDSVYFGAGAYGAQAASQTYFHKNVSELSISEAAMLVAIIPAPSKYGPRENITIAEQRRKLVVREMAELGMITEEERVEAREQALWYAPYGDPPRPMAVLYPPPATDNGAYPYYVDYIRTYLLDKYGPEQLYRGGLTIVAAFDPNLQRLAEEKVSGAMAGTSSPLEMSLVTVEPSTGLVKALVGGRDWNASQVNLALGGSQGMQPGSSIKAFTVAEALEEGYSPETIYNAPAVFTVPGCGGSCGIRGGAGGPISMREATAQSTNTYFAQLILDLGPNNVAEMANRLGVTRITLDKQYTLGLTLGAYEVSPLDMAAGFSVFANHGVKPGVTPVAWVIDGSGTLLEDNTNPHGPRVLNAAVADMTTELLEGVVDHGTGQRADIGRPVAGKTGSAQEYKAAWFVGYTPQLATAIWVGYSDAPKPLYNLGGFSGAIMGGTLPARTFSEFMRAAHEGAPVVDFTPPGILPPPSSNIRQAPEKSPIIDMPLDCGGPCVATPTLTSPTTVAPEAAVGGEDAGENCPAADPEDTTTTRPRSGAPNTTVATLPRKGPP
jgi:penicillin-binding protein 1A